MPDNELMTDLEVTEEPTEETTEAEVVEEATEETTEEESHEDAEEVEAVAEETVEEKAARLEKQLKKIKNRNISLLKQRNQARRDAEANVKQPEKPQRPKITQFRDDLGEVDYEKYEEALDTYEDAKSEYVAKTTPKPVTPQQEKFQKQLEIGSEKYDDFEEVALSKDVPYTPFTVQAVVGSDHGADLAYYLGENIDVAQKIADMSMENPVKAAKLIADIERKFNGASRVNKVKASPNKPLTPVGGKRSTEIAKDPSKMSTDEWMKWNKERDIQKLKEKYGG